MTIHFFNTDPTKTSLDYEGALTKIQESLQSLPYGSMKSFCEEHDLPYYTISKIKNNKISFVAPLLIKKCLIAFGYKNIEHLSKEFFTFDK